MASRRADIRAERRSIGLLSPSDDEEPDEQPKEDTGRTRLRTLRSMIVRVNSDETRDEGGCAGGSRSPPPPPPPSLGGGQRHRDADHSNRQTAHSRRRSEGNRPMVDSDSDFSGLGYSRFLSQRGGEPKRSNTKGSLEVDGTRGDYKSRLGSERMGNRDWDGGRPAAAASLRGLDHGRERVALRRENPSRSSLRRHRIRRDVDERGRDGKNLEIGRKSIDEVGDRDGNDDEGDENDVKWNATQYHRECFRGRGERDGGGGGSHAHNYLRDHRGCRDASPGSGGWRSGDGAGSRSPLGIGRYSWAGARNGNFLGNDRGTDDFGCGRGEPDRERDGGRGGETRETPAPELYSIHRATVHSIRPFGIFVRLDGYRNHGLVNLCHLSHFEITSRKDSDARKVEAISSVVAEGDQVWVKVISLQQDGERVKVGCSLKLVSQGDGKDLDTNHLQVEKCKSKAAWEPPEKLELDALHHVSTHCTTYRHSKKECYSTGNKSYELLVAADTDDDGPAGSSKAKRFAPMVGPSFMPPSGPAGRGRAMVQPAWMTHGVGVGGNQEKVLGGHNGKAMSDLPHKLHSTEDALAVLGKGKEARCSRQILQRRHCKYRNRDRKHTSKGQREKYKKRHRSDHDHHHRSKRRRRV